MKNDDLYSLCKRFATVDPSNRCTTPNAVYNALQQGGVKTLEEFMGKPLEELAEVRYVGPKKLIVMAKMKYEDRLVFAKKVSWCSPSLTVEYLLKEWQKSQNIKDYIALDDFFEKVIKGEIAIIDEGEKKAPNDEWEVLVHGVIEEGEDYQISVIRKDNTHGHNSWGWGDENKIILFSNRTGFGNPVHWKVAQKREFMLDVAHKLCDALNGV